MEGAVIAALLRGSAEVARNLTNLRCWPSDAFAGAYDELARKGHLHHLLLRAQQPIQLLEHVLSCGNGSALRIVALVNAVAGRPAERSILTLMVEVERRSREGQSCQRPCLVDQLRVAGATDFARKLDSSIACEVRYTEFPVAELLEYLERNGPSVSPGAVPQQRLASTHSHVRRSILRELCRRCCSPHHLQLDGLDHTILVEMLQYACPHTLTDPCGSSGCRDALPPSAVAILHAFLRGNPSELVLDAPLMLCDHAGGRLLQRFVRGIVACVFSSWQHACEKKLQPCEASDNSTALSSVFQYASSIQKLLFTPEGRRVLSHVAEDQRRISAHCDATIAVHKTQVLELSFSWVETQKLQEQTRTHDGVHDTETASRLAHFWLFLASRASRSSRLWSHWHAAVESPGGVLPRSAASQLRSTLTEILDLMCPNGRQLDAARGVKRRRNIAKSTIDNASVALRINRNLPLLGCLHSLLDVMIGSVHNLPELHHEAAELCSMLLDVFDGLVEDSLHIKRLRLPGSRTGAVQTTVTTTKAVDMSLEYTKCSEAILKLVHSICRFVNRLDEECGTLVWQHHSELILSRFARLVGGVPSMRIFAVVAVYVTNSVFPVGECNPADAVAEPNEHGAQIKSHNGQLWRLFGEIVLQLRRWYTSHNKGEADDLSTESMTSLLTLPACRLVQPERCDHSDLPNELEMRAWCTGVVRELLLCLHQHQRTETEAVVCDAFIVSVLDALFHLTSQPYQHVLAEMWKRGDGGDPAASASHGQGTCESTRTCVAMEVLVTCANVLRFHCRATRSASQDGSVRPDRCCAGAAKVMLGLLRATAMVSSEEIQRMSIVVMLTETGQEPSLGTKDVMSSLIRCGFGNSCENGIMSRTTTVSCARCLQYIVGLHDQCAAAMLVEDTSFSDALLGWGITRMEQATLQTVHSRTASAQPFHGSSKSTQTEQTGDAPDDVYELVSSVAGLLALCVERAASPFWSQFRDDVRFFKLLRYMLDIVLLQTGGPDEANANVPTNHVYTQAAKHTMRLVGNVADALTFASELNLAGVPQRLQELADKGANIGLSSEDCARVAQVVRAISS